MAVQAQYPSNAFRSHNNILDQFQQLQQQQYRDNNGGNLFGFSNNYAGQQILNGTVFSEPESELTCNVSRSRKRNRDDQMALAQHHQQQQKQQQQFRFESMANIQPFDRTATTSTGLQPSKENGLYESQGTSTSGRSSGVSPPSSSLVARPLAQDISSYLYHQNLEIDAVIRLQNEKLRLVLEETRKRHCRSILSVLEQKVIGRLKEKEAELENVSRRNAELEEKVKQMSDENQIWFSVAKNNEAMVSSLKSSLEEIFLQKISHSREGFGENDGGIAVLGDDAQSCCYEGLDEDKKLVTEKTMREDQELGYRKSCKVCCENDVSVLLLPCRHLCLCKECESKHDSCPICNCMKNASLQIFMS